MNLIQAPPNCYRAYGEIIYSHVVIPFLPSINSNKNDIEFILSNDLDNNDFKKNNYPFALSKKGARVFKNNVFKANIAELGDKIIFCNFDENVSNHDIAFQLLTHPVAASLFLKNFYVLHCSAVEINNKAYLFCAPSGHGKSYVAAKLLSVGRLICEDIGKVEFKNGKAYIYPAMPCLKVSEQFFKKNRIEFKEVFKIKGDARNRLGCVTDSFDLSNKPIEVHKCFFLKESKQFSIHRINEVEFFRTLVMSSVSPIPRNKCMRSEKQVLKNISSFISSVDAYTFERPLVEDIEPLLENIFSRI